MIEAGWDVAIGHGNGPQVGFILRRSEIAAKVEGMHEVPLDVCGADSQGAIGYEFQQALQNEYHRRGIKQGRCDRHHTGAGGQERPRLQETDQADRLVHG
jgi:carbamate kinase